jgi:hypothetical protein
VKSEQEDTIISVDRLSKFWGDFPSLFSSVEKTRVDLSGFRTMSVPASIRGLTLLRWLV